MIKSSTTRIKTEIRPVPCGFTNHDCLSQAHRDVLRTACLDDIVVLLNADLVLSEGSLSFCEQQLSNGKLAIACASVRVNQEGKIEGASNGRDLHNWAWKNRHQITKESTWPYGRTGDLSRIYFEELGNVVSRVCLPHPLAIKIDERQLFFYPTIDVNLLGNFDISEIYMVTSPDEVALVDLVSKDYFIGISDSSIDEKFTADNFIFSGNLQRWFVRHRVVICGQSVNLSSDRVVDEVLG